MALTATGLGSANNAVAAALVLTVGASASVGDLVVVGVTNGANSTFTLTDSASNTWQSHTLSQTQGDSGVFWSVLTGAMTSGVSTITIDATTQGHFTIAATRFSGVTWDGTSATVEDRFAYSVHGGTRTITSTPTLPLRSAHELAYGMYASTSAGASTFTRTGSWADDPNTEPISDFFIVFSAYNEVTDFSPQNFVGTQQFRGSGHAYVVTFKIV